MFDSADAPSSTARRRCSFTMIVQGRVAAAAVERAQRKPTAVRGDRRNAQCLRVHTGARGVHNARTERAFEERTSNSGVLPNVGVDRWQTERSAVGADHL